jgi:hypothetical protein
MGQGTTRQYNIIHKIIIIIIQYNNIIRQGGKVIKKIHKAKGKARQSYTVRQGMSGTKFKIILTICFAIGCLNLFLVR